MWTYVWQSLWWIPLGAITCSVVLPQPVEARATIAVASNFAPCLRTLVRSFSAERLQSVLSDKFIDDIIVVPGSTGKHYAQILAGAPFDAFFAADAQRPRLLAAKARIVEGSRFIYALGRLVLWYPGGHARTAPWQLLVRPSIHHIAIANAKLAPYGAAAEQVLQSWGVYQAVLQKLVRGENIAQTYHFVDSGNAEIGLVALSLVRQTSARGLVFPINAHRHQPIEQEAVLLRENAVAMALLKYSAGPQGRATIASCGYDLP